MNEASSILDSYDWRATFEDEHAAHSEAQGPGTAMHELF